MISKKIVTPNQVNRALETQKIYGGKLGTNLIELGFISDEDLAQFLSEQSSVPRIQREELENIPREIIHILDKETVKKLQIVPFRNDQRLHIAVSDPSKINAFDKIQYETGKRINRVIAPEVWILAALERYYGITREIRPLSISVVDEDFSEVVILGNETPLSLTQNEMSLDERVDEKQDNVSPLDSIQEFISEVSNAETPTKIFQNLFRYLSPFFDKMMVFRKNQNLLRGWLLSGIPLHLKNFQEIEFSFPPEIQKEFEKNSKPLSQVQVSQIFPDKYVSYIGLKEAENLAVYPIAFRGELKMFFMGINKNHHFNPMPVAGNIIPLSIQKTAIAIEILYLQKQFQKLPDFKKEASDRN